MNKCSRCGKSIEGDEIKFAREGDWMGKPLCRRCRTEVEEESRERYRKGRSKDNEYSDQQSTSIYDRNIRLANAKQREYH
jgi:ribosome-binding protein aMBF1 (putative translation factor)